MKLTTTLLAAVAVIALSAPSYAQVTPGGAGERHLNESPSTAGKAGTMPTTAPEHAVAPKKMMKGTTGSAGSVSPDNPQTSGVKGARKANEIPGAK